MSTPGFLGGHKGAGETDGFNMINKQPLDELCAEHGFSLELNPIPSDEEESQLAILVPAGLDPIELVKRKDELVLLEKKLRELCPAIKSVMVQCAAD